MSELIFTGRARPHYFLPGTVYEAALKRIRWIYEEFDGHVSVSSSGGKDSTVVLELTLQVAAELGALPVKVHFLDQECEYQATVDYQRHTADRPETDFDWYQMPFKLFNAANHDDEWLNVWDPALDDSTWIRPKEPDSIHENPFFDWQTESLPHFKKTLHHMNRHDGGAILTGMRCEESPTRRVFMTSKPSYKWVTWASGAPGKKGEPRAYYLFHPIYDWSYRDVWKAILQNQWTYNTFYEAQFRYGISLRNMRVSSFHHEQSMGSLDYLQEVEPQTWERATRRLSGLNAYAHVGEDQFHTRGVLPHMFASWEEYLDHLITKLVPSEENQAKFYKQWEKAKRHLPFIPSNEIAKSMVGSVIGNDVYGTNMDIWITANKHPGKKREWEDWAERQRKASVYQDAV